MAGEFFKTDSEMSEETRKTNVEDLRLQTNGCLGNYAVLPSC